MDNKEDVLGELRAEEDRMRKQREKDDAKRDTELERERQQDISSGKEVLDKKFQQLEFLMNKSKVSIEWRSKINTQAVNE
jgi:ATP-dependent DNA helicase